MWKKNNCYCLCVFKKIALLNLQWICAFQIMSKPTPKCHWLANISTVFFVSTTARLYELIFSVNGCLYEHQTWSVPSVSSILICTDSLCLSHILSGKGECFTKVWQTVAWLLRAKATSLCTALLRPDKSRGEGGQTKRERVWMSRMWNRVTWGEKCIASWGIRRSLEPVGVHYSRITYAVHIVSF